MGEGGIMVKKLILKVVMASLILLCGCATTYKIGEKFNSENVYKITNNKTTQKQILQYFGTPWRKGLKNGNDIFVYSYEEFVFKINHKVEKKGNTLVIEFDENKIVENFYFNLPGKEPVIIGIMIHKRREEQEQEIMMHSHVTGLY